jgi:hypothetical protein
MFVYELLLVTGAIGLIAMALMGFGHHGGLRGPGHHVDLHGSHTGHLHAGAGGSHAPLAGHSAHAAPTAHPVGTGHAGHHGVVRAAGHSAAEGGREQSGGGSLLSVLSPVTLFAGCLGAGAAGSLLTHWGLPAPEVVAGALGAAVLLNALLVRPMMRLVMGFASTPARGLVGALMERAEAITAFDANGEGLVRVLVDGQSVDVLARLSEEERRQGVHVQRGQSVRIEDVDAQKNCCTVSRL